MPENDATHPALSGPPASSGESLVKVTAAEFAEFQTLKALKPQFDDFRSKHEADLATKETELGTLRQAFDAQKAEWETKLSEATGQAGKLREAYLERTKAEALASGLAGVEFVGDSPEVKARVAAKFRETIAGGFEVKDGADGKPVVVDRASGLPAADALKAILADPANQGFLAPRTRGGAGTDGTGSGTPVNPNGNPHQFNSIEWHGWNMRRSAVNLSGLINRNDR